MKRLFYLFGGLFKIHKVIADIKNYVVLRKIIRKESKSSPVWAKMGLRVDWVGRIYTVYNLPPEVTMSRDMPKETWIAFVIEQAKPINEYLTSLNLQEILVPNYSLIEGTESYLLMYQPYFQELNLWWVFSRFVFWFFLIRMETKYQWLTQLWHWASNII